MAPTGFTLTPNPNTNDFPKDQQHEQVLYARVRLATKSDVPFIHKLIHKMAAYHNLSHECEVTEYSLLSTIFNSQCSSNINVFLTEVSPKAFASLVEHDLVVSDHVHQLDPLNKMIHLPHLIEDPKESSFCTSDGTIITGFALFFESYSTFLGKHGIHLEDLFVREDYRGMGFGGMLLKALANLTVRLGYARMEWAATTWNVDSHKFYEKMGAYQLEDWRIFRLDGDSLLSYGQLK